MDSDSIFFKSEKILGVIVWDEEKYKPITVACFPKEDNNSRKILEFESLSGFDEFIKGLEKAKRWIEETRKEAEKE